MRVYLATTLPGLAEAWKAGRLAAEAPAHAVTPALREWYVGGDEEELEYAATREAARSSLALLAAEAESGPENLAWRRVVVAVDLPDGQVRPDPDTARSAVRLEAAGEGPRIKQVAAVHVDEADAEAVVRDAVRAWPAAQSGDDDAEFAVDEADGFELLWYARQEIPDLIE